MADLGSIGDGSKLSVILNGPEASGVVTDSTAAPVLRTVRLIRRDTSALIWATQSRAADGSYVLLSPPGSSGVEHQVVFLDDDAGSLENDLIHRVIL